MGPQGVFKEMDINIYLLTWIYNYLLLIIINYQTKFSTIFSQWEMFHMMQMKEGKVIIYSNIIHCSVVM